MPWGVAAAGAIAAAGSVGGSMLQANAQKGAAGTQSDADMAALRQQADLSAQSRMLLAPWVQAGQSQLPTLQDLFVDPQERLRQINSQRIALQGTVDKYSTPTDFASTPILTGKNASERRQTAYMQTEQERLNNLKEAQNALDTYNKQNSDEEKALQSQASTGTTYAADQLKKLQASPLFDFESGLVTRNLNRNLAARGLDQSGASNEALAFALSGLAGEEGQRTIANMFQLTNLGAQAASGTVGINQNQANNAGNLLAAQGQANAGGILGSGNAYASGLRDANNAAMSSGGGIMTYNLLNKPQAQPDTSLNDLASRLFPSAPDPVATQAFSAGRTVTGGGLNFGSQGIEATYAPTI